MPISKEYGGHGREVKANMRKKYGKSKGDEVYYATINKRKQKQKAKRKAVGHPKGRAERRTLAARFGI